MRLLLLGVLSPTVGAWMVAQAAEFDPVSLLGQIGLGAVFAVPWFYLWRDERRQRIESERREREGFREMGPVLVRAVEVLDTVAQGVEGTVQRAAAAIPPRSETDHVIRRVELIAGELTDELNRLRREPPGGK